MYRGTVPGKGGGGEEGRHEGRGWRKERWDYYVVERREERGDGRNNKSRITS